MTAIVRRKAPNPMKGARGFKPGKSGNPAGRPVGAKGKITVEWERIQTLAADCLPEAIESLRVQALKGKQWAIQMLLKLSRPKEIIEIDHEDGAEHCAEKQIAGLVKGMARFKYYTQDQTLQAIDTLAKINNLKIAEAQVVTPVNMEVMMRELEAVERLLEHKEKEEQAMVEANCEEVALNA